MRKDKTLSEDRITSVSVELSPSEARQLYGLLHRVIAQNREEFFDNELEFLGNIKRKISDAVYIS
jgi:hypothetical protein